MCSTQPRISWSPRFLSPHSRSCLPLHTSTILYMQWRAWAWLLHFFFAQLAFLPRKWREQLNQQNQPFPPGLRQPPWQGNRWRRQDCYQRPPLNSVINPQIMFKYQQLIKENLSEIAKLITVEQVFQNFSIDFQRLTMTPIPSAICMLPGRLYFWSLLQGKTHQDAEGDVMRGLQVEVFQSFGYLEYIPRWWNLCVQTQPWCWERPWLVSARTWTWPAIGGTNFETCDLGLPGFRLVCVPALPLLTSLQWFPSGCFPQALLRATPMSWRSGRFSNWMTPRFSFHSKQP